MAIFLGGGDDSWVGSSAADETYGEGGADHLRGLKGNDTLDGGTGDDTLEGGNNADLLRGGDGADILFGQDGDDTLVAGGVLESEVLFGYAGRDTADWSETAGATWVIDLAADQAVANGAVFQSIFSIESVRTGGGDDKISGSKAANFIDGGTGDDTMIGRGGDDTFFDSGGSNYVNGGKGNDYANVNGVTFAQLGEGNDGFYGSLGDDTIYAGVGDDSLRGYNGRDYIIGGKGNDTIDGQAGDDLLFGEGGQDIFRFTDIAHTTAAAPDTIDDWVSNDRIDLGTIDARTNKSGDQAFKIVGAFTGVSGQLVISYDSGADVTVIEGDVDGDGVADMRIEVLFDVRGSLHFIL